jgi:hypothetical protein
MPRRSNRIFQSGQVLSRMRARPMIDHAMMGIMTGPPFMIRSINICILRRRKKRAIEIALI